jgi:hypothetical protein
MRYNASGTPGSQIANMLMLTFAPTDKSLTANFHVPTQRVAMTPRKTPQPKPSHIFPNISSVNGRMTYRIILIHRLMNRWIPAFLTLSKSDGS